MSAEDNRLSVGSGRHYAEGWCNFDLNSPGPEFRSPDVYGSVYEMPFEDERFTQVYLGHLLEHLEWDTIPEALTEVIRVAASGARVAVVGPCIERAVKSRQPQWLLDMIVAHEDERPGEGHAWTPTAMLTLMAMETVPWSDGPQLVDVATIDKPEWPNPTTVNWQCAVVAVA